MKQILFSLCFLIAGSSAFSQTARIQIIHNAADPAAASVDVYLDGSILNDDFQFRTASPFINAPAGSPIDIGIAPGTSTSVNDTIANFNVTLTPGETYVAIANGVLNPAMFAANPDSESTAFTLFLKDGVQETGTSALVDFFAVHGSTDAPIVDVIARDVTTLVDNAKYGDITGYIGVPDAPYILDVTPGADNSTIVASFEADLSGLGGGSAVVFASGFLDPDANMGGPAFGLFAALADGTVVAFNPLSGADVQVIHNAADPAAATVDIYLGDNILLDDFNFREATPFVNLPSNSPIRLGVAPGTSTSIVDTLTSFTVTLNDGESYAVIANGVLDPAMFAANPDGESTAFTLFLQDAVQQVASNPANVEFRAVHGATDAPIVDVLARFVGPIVEDAKYGDITSDVGVPPSTYYLDVTPGSDNSTIVSSFRADLSGLAGGSAIVFASGFLDPTANMDGEEFALLAALADGTVVPFEKLEGSRLQVIHNAADPAAASVDIYLDGGLLLDDFAFRSATPFINAVSETPISIAVAPGTSTSVSDALATFNVTLDDGETYVAIANGVLDPGMFAANPDGASTAFDLLVGLGVREEALDPANVDFIALHGATDAPAVDVIARGVGTLVDDAPYSGITPYISVPADQYTLDVTPAADNDVVVGTFDADLSGLAGSSAVVFASGFLDPDVNMGGEAFGLWAALADGTVVPFGEITTARLQVIHNAADPAAATVDIYLNGDILLDDFDFRTATPFIDAPANESINIGVAPGTSSSFSDTLTSFDVTLLAQETYVAIANGVLDPSMFAANPEGKSTAFTLFLKDNILEEGTDPANVDFIAVHGASDAPEVDVIARDVATLVDDATYGDITDYIAVPAGAYTLDVTPGNDNLTIVASFDADLSGLGGGSAIVFASGFLTPADNMDGEAFGLFAALADGTVVAFSIATGIEDFVNLESVNVFPNPVVDMVNISINATESEEIDIQIVDISGKLIQSSNDIRIGSGLSNISLNVNGIVPGLYFVRILGENNAQVIYPIVSQ